MYTHKVHSYTSIDNKYMYKKNTFHEDYNNFSGDNKDLRETSFCFFQSSL